ncbi:MULTISPECIES: TatD family hydrolase [Salimicrobium]|uniref:Hydrolase TatD n=1 Tax=Salimicrobium humidisoli TaxID=2029857 RepID=A0ABX4HPW3_9BACI|nr:MULTISPECIES: TatD family hydrolase [Salimicrobium]PBB04922.1 hydrolase TatD [Salimicrobium humidisoli]
MLFDTHVHLNADQFEEDRNETIRRAREAGVEYMTVVGFDRKTIPKALEIAESDENIYAAVGWHPVDAVDMKEEDLEWIEGLADHPKVVAIGEMGLDYHWDKSPKDVQKEVFKKQIALAKRVKLPIIIHNREATEDIIEVLEQEHAEDVGGIMHCYNGPVEYAERAIAMNFMISLGGPVTFKNAKLPKEVAKAVEMKHLLVETDAPFLAPHPNRGKRNEPAWVKLVAEQIAELKELPYEEVAETTTDNAKKFFGIKS